MVSLYKFIGESVQSSKLRILAEFLTNIKARNFVGFALPFKLPLDASKYTRMELEEFDPVVSSAVAQPGDPMWILVMDHEIWVYKRTNDEWDQFTRGAAGNFRFTSRTSRYPIGRLREWGAELFLGHLEEHNHHRWGKKLSRGALNAWIRHAGEVFTPNFDRKGLGKFMSYSKLSGSDRIVMNHFIEFIGSVFDSTGKISNAELIQRMLGGNYIIDIDLLTPARLRNVLRKIQEDLGDLYPTLERAVGLVEELMEI